MVWIILWLKETAQVFPTSNTLLEVTQLGELAIPLRNLVLLIVQMYVINLIKLTLNENLEDIWIHMGL